MNHATIQVIIHGTCRDFPFQDGGSEMSTEIDFAEDVWLHDHGELIGRCGAVADPACIYLAVARSALHE
jgi:hypothetical protein